MLDLNCDMGESFGVYRYGTDAAMAPLITSANIACGAHAGDPKTMRETVALAADHGVSVGAHVGLPDREGFGRREIAVTSDQVYEMCLAQVGALEAFCRVAGAPLVHVKPHGALYMMATRDLDLAAGIARAIAGFDPALAVYALPGSSLAAVAAESGLRVVTELFADRPYTGTEVTMFGWGREQLGSPTQTAERVTGLLADERFASVGTICVHSDTQDAPALMGAVRQRLVDDGVQLAALPPVAASRSRETPGGLVSRP